MSKEATNCKITMKGNIMTITIDLSKDYGLSTSGKSKIIASTRGNKPVDGHPNTFIGINCYKKVPK